MWQKVELQVPACILAIHMLQCKPKVTWNYLCDRLEAGQLQEAYLSEWISATTLHSRI